MSFDINNSSYNAYLKSNKSFTSSKIKQMEDFAQKGLEDVKKSSTSTITKNGKTYYVVKVDGESYLYDYENDSYSKFNKDGSSTKEITYNAQSDSVSVADSNDKRKENFSYDSTKSENNFTFITANRDNNIFAKNVTVIDSFTEAQEGTIDENTSVTFSHGEIVSAILEAGGSKVNKIGSTLKYSDIANNLQSVLTELEKGADIDAVNMSISVGAFPSLFGVTELSSGNADSLYTTLKGIKGSEAIISILDKIKELSDKGVSVYISAGNEADDTGADNLEEIIGYTENTDNSKTGRNYNVFNLLTLSATNSNKNVHVIGSSKDDSTSSATLDNSAFYSNYNDLVDKLYDGNIQFSYVSDNGNGTYKFYVENVGYCNLKLTAEELQKLKGKSFTVLGTSFATPYAVSKDDTSLA